MLLFVKHKFTSRQAFRLALVGVSFGLCLAVNLKAIANNNRANVGEGATNSSEFLIAQQSRTQRVRFPRGRNSTTIQNAVVRGTRDTYVLNARAGQTMTVNISAVENNAVFDIVAPNRQTIRQGVTSFSGRLPVAGDYRIVVGGTRGNATYRLQVAIR